MKYGLQFILLSLILNTINFNLTKEKKKFLHPKETFAPIAFPLNLRRDEKKQKSDENTIRIPPITFCFLRSSSQSIFTLPIIDGVRIFDERENEVVTIRMYSLPFPIVSFACLEPRN